MNKKNLINKSLIFEIIILLASICIIIFSFLADLSIISLPHYLILNIKDTEGLFLTLFTVQASVSTVSIAIVSLITGLINDNILGISISGFITYKRHKIFKHNILIITSLIITLFNYICLSITFFNLCVTLFFLNIFIVILLVSETCIIFLGKNNIRIQIEKYVMCNYNKDILNEIQRELFISIEIGNMIETNSILDTIKLIFEKEVRRSNYTMTAINKQILEIICDSFEKVILLHNSQKSNKFLNYICDIYTIANGNENKTLHLYLWEDIASSFSKAIRDLDYEQLKDDLVYLKLHSELCKNLKDRNEDNINASNIKYYASWIYSLLKENQKLNPDEIKQVRDKLYNMINSTLNYRTFNINDKILDTLLVNELCNLHKLMIDNGDCEGILNLFFNDIHYIKYKKFNDLIYVITMIYLYYLAKRENLVIGNILCEYANKILEENHSVYSYFYYDINIFKIAKENLDFIKAILSGWEYNTEKRVKCLIMDSVIEDFFIFVSLSKYWEYNEINNVVEILAPKSMFYLYNRYFAQDNGEGIKKLYSEFEILINKEKEEKIIEEKMLILKDVFNKRYRDYIIYEGKNKKITDEQKEWFAKKVKDNLSIICNETMNPFKFYNEDLNSPFFTYSKIIVYRDIVSYYVFDEKTFDKYIRNNLITEFITIFLNKIIENIEYKKLFYNDKYKQKTIIDLAKDTGINANIAIGNREEFWEEKDTFILKNYTENMKRIKYPGGYNYFFLLDSSLIEFSMEDIEIKYDDLSWDDYKNKCKEIDSENVLYNVTNDIYIPFSKDELKEYINNTEQLITVYANIKVRLKGDKVGVGIEITTKK